ncbi:MAG: hypothetical protein WBB47_01895, partial [Paenisporosarcina sp.]
KANLLRTSTDVDVPIFGEALIVDTKAPIDDRNPPIVDKESPIAPTYPLIVDKEPPIARAAAIKKSKTEKLIC